MTKIGLFGLFGFLLKDNPTVKSYTKTLYGIIQRNPIQEAKTIEEIDNEYYNSEISSFMEKYYISPISNKSSMIFLSGSNCKNITEEIAKDLNCPSGMMKIVRNSVSGESNIEILENISNRNVVLVSSIAPPVNDNLVELLFTIATLKRSSAKKIIVVIPYFGYSKKAEKDSTSNSPLYASLIVKLIESMGADQILSVNLASKHITGYSSSIPIIDLDMTGLAVSYFIEKKRLGKIMNPVVISPHVKSVPKAKKLQEMLSNNGLTSGLGFIAQSQKSSEEKIDFHVTKDYNYIGDEYKGKDVIIIDDMIQTGGTICKLADVLKKEGSGNIYSVVFHDLMRPEVSENISSSKLKEVVVLDKSSDTVFSNKIVRLKYTKLISSYLNEML